MAPHGPHPATIWLALLGSPLDALLFVHAKHSHLSAPGALWACSFLWHSCCLMLQPTGLPSMYGQAQKEKEASKLLKGALCSFQYRAVIFGLSSTTTYPLRYLSEMYFTFCTWQRKHIDAYQQCSQVCFNFIFQICSKRKDKGVFFGSRKFIMT